jgi:hypothetical protein
MGALPAVSKVVRVDFHMADAGDLNVQNREFFRYSGALSWADAATWLHNIQVAWNVLIHANCSTAFSTVYAELTDLTSTSAPQVTDATTTSGVSATARLPLGTAMVIRKEIARRYRGGHPRVYLSGLVAAYLATATQWDPASLASVVSAYNTFITAATANTNPAAIGTIDHVNVSYFSGFTNHTFPSGRTKAIPTPRVTPLVDLIIGTAGNPAPASQRRRNETP